MVPTAEVQFPGAAGARTHLEFPGVHVIPEDAGRAGVRQDVGVPQHDAPVREGPVPRLGARAVVVHERHRLRTNILELELGVKRTSKIICKEVRRDGRSARSKWTLRMVVKAAKRRHRWCSFRPLRRIFCVPTLVKLSVERRAGQERELRVAGATGSVVR